MNSKTLNRYIWLLDTILQQSGLTFDKIQKHWENSALSQGKPLTLRTFHEHRKAINELFGVEIKCENGYKYSISQSDKKMLEKDHIRQWLLNSFTISNMIEAGHNMKERIIFEEIPKGTGYLKTIIDAMQRSMEIEFKYGKFGSRQDKPIRMQPYAIKVYQRRWYVIGYTHKYEQIRVIALDRISPLYDMEITKTRFTIPDSFNAEAYFKNVVGIYVNEDLVPQKVVLRAYGEYIEYLRSLPIHSSQKEIGYKGNYCDFEYHVCLTPDLTSQIMALGVNVEVLEPAELRDTIKSTLRKALERYE